MNSDLIENVLLVDDDLPTNFIHEVILKKSNRFQNIQSVLSANAALAFIEGQVPDLILLDINMPAISGWDFIEQYRSLPDQKKKNTKIIMLSTSIDPLDRERAEGISEIHDFLNKPISIDKIEEIIERHFNSQ